MSFDHRKYHAHAAISRPQRRWPDQIIRQAPDWCSVDLRDGNQALARPMSVAQKKELFSLLVALGFKEIEVGFPAASQPDHDFVRELIEGNLIPADVTIQVLTQAREALIARTFESLAGVERAVVHLYNSTSRVQRERVFREDREGIVKMARQGAFWVKDHAARFPDTQWVFQYSPESFTGTELDFAIEVINSVTDIWRPDQGQPVIINLPATVETSTPNVFADQVETVIDAIDYRQHLRISLHTHNDRGCAVAAAELGIMAGADRIEGTLLGNGERTGNTDLITLAMNLYSQGVDPKLDLSRMREIVEVVEGITGIAVHPRHPYAGELVYAAFSGSHQDAIRKCLAIQEPDAPWEVAYLPIDPADVGRRYEEVVRINSQSGKGGVLHVLERDYGITMPRWLQIALSQAVQRQAEDHGGELNSKAIHGLFQSHFRDIPKGWQIRDYDLSRESDQVRASLTIEGMTHPVSGHGHGALEAAVQALTQAAGQKVSVTHYDEFALDQGTEAQAMACVRIQMGNRSQDAVAIALDSTLAAMQAVASAVGRALARNPVMPAEAAVLQVAN